MIAAALVLSVIVLALAVYAFNRADEEIRSRVEGILSTHYPKMQVTVAGARLVRGEGVVVRELIIRDPKFKGPPLVSIDEIVWRCNIDLAELAKGRLPKIEQIIARRPAVHAVLRANNTWNFEDLLPLPKFGNRTPKIKIENASVEIVRSGVESLRPLALRQINLSLTPRAPAPGQTEKPPIDVVGELSGEHVRAIRVAGLLKGDFKACKLEGSFDQLEVSPELFASAPPELAKAIEAAPAFRGAVFGKFKVMKYSDPRVAVDYEVSGQLIRGRVDDSRLPYPVTDLTGGFRATPQGFTVEGLSARSGTMRLFGKFHSTGYTPTSPMRVELSAKRLLLDQEAVLRATPKKYRSHWFKYQPAGVVDIDFSAATDGREWRPEVNIRCVDVAFTHYLFPYRLEHARGSLRYKDDALSLQLTALSDRNEILVRSELARLKSKIPVGYIDVSGKSVRIDDRVLAALKKKSSEVLQSLHPQGRFDFAYRAWRDPNAPPGPMHQNLTLGILDGRLCCEKFPYPLDRINGTVRMQDGYFTFENDLQGRNAEGTVYCVGSLAPTDAGGELHLHFTSKNVRLDHQLKAALPESAQRLWGELKPQGAVDIEADFRHRPGATKPDLIVKAIPVADTVSIEPAAFPYRFERMTGEFVMRDSHVTMRGIRAHHGRSRMSAQGSCSLLSQSGWRLDLNNLAVERLAPDRALLHALPENLRRALVNLKTNGSTDVYGALSLISEGPGIPMAALWDVKLDVQQSRMTCGVDFENINGGIKLTGGSRGKQFHSTGELDLHSLTWQDTQITDVRGPLWWDEQRFVLGVDTKKFDPKSNARPLTGQLYDGVLRSNAIFNFGPTTEYSVAAALSKASLGRFLRESAPGLQFVSGEVEAEVRLTGAGQGIHNLRGEGSVRIGNANLYELPVMVSLLKILSIRSPDTTAFTEGDLDFWVDGEHLYVKKLRFGGDAVSLVAEEGDIHLTNKSLDVPFYALVGRESQFSLAKALARGAAQQMYSIHVDGPIAEPRMTRQALPGLNSALKNIQAELQGGLYPASAATPQTAAQPTTLR